MTELPFGRNFLPGPVDVHPDILQAMAGPTMGWPEMGELMEEIEAPLRRLFGSVRPVLIGTCSGTGFMEAAIRNGVRHRMLAVVSGYFGERFARVAEACGKHVVRAGVPPGATLRPEHLERFLQGPPIDAVAIVHSETSTGALAPLAALAAVARGRDDVVTLVDAVSSVGALPLAADLHHLDFVFTSSQKALGLPPGIALAVASPRMMARAREAEERAGMAGSSARPGNTFPPRRRQRRSFGHWRHNSAGSKPMAGWKSAFAAIRRWRTGWRRGATTLA
jgi:aspartate aminotransferase-like enzyme